MRCCYRQTGGYEWARICKIINAFLETHERSADDLQCGLKAWLSGSDDPEADAAGIILAETLLMHRAWLKSKMRDGGPQREIVIGG